MLNDKGNVNKNHDNQNDVNDICNVHKQSQC